jgi:hypothetical protein
VNSCSSHYLAWIHTWKSPSCLCYIYALFSEVKSEACWPLHHANSPWLNCISVTNNFFSQEFMLCWFRYWHYECIICKASDGAVKMGTKLGRAWTEVGIASFKLLFHDPLIQSPDLDWCPGWSWIQGRSIPSHLVIGIWLSTRTYITHCAGSCYKPYGSMYVMKLKTVSNEHQRCLWGLIYGHSVTN